MDSKESVIKEILSKYAGKLTYINVRVPSKPSYRMVSSDSVGQGSGTSGQDYADASQKVDGATTGAMGTGATTDATTATGAADATTTAAGEASAAQSGAQSGDAGEGQGQAASTAGE